MTRIPRIPDNWQHFGLSLLFTIVLPLVPLGIEWWFKGVVSCQSLTLGVSIYAVSVGVASGSQLLLGFTFLVSLIFAMVFGLVISAATPPPHCDGAAYFSIACISLVHCGERWNRHLVDKKKFWNL